MAIQWRGPVPASSQTIGRRGRRVELVVDDWAVVMFEGAIRRFKDPASILSAHYVIGADGRIAQLVSEDDTAYHAGVFSVNQRSIGIESVLPNADLSGPDVETGQAFDPETISRR
jgi:N-acetyl-anhydromuramyl-L-alanine amidase AmpD